MLKIFSFIKDEQEIINDWLLHHADIVGNSNIIVVDNGSTDDTHSILKQWADDGVTVLSNTSPFKYKSKIITSTINQHAHDGFVLPLDCDEFLVSNHKKKIDVTRDSILNEFHRLSIDDGYRYKLDQFDVVPGTQNIDYNISQLYNFNRVNNINWKKNLAKTFYHKRWFISTDQGNHHGFVRGSGRKLWTNLALLHYNVRSYKHFVEKNTKGAKAYGHDKHKQLTHCLGAHYHRRYWSIQNGTGKEQMLSEFNKKDSIKISNMSTRLIKLRETSSNNKNK